MTSFAWDRDQHLHQPFYCEENVWQLLRATLPAPVSAAWALLIRAESGPVWMTAQRLAEANQVVGWDYHVVALLEIGDRAWVADLDSRLPWPTPLQTYAEASFPPFVPVAGRPRFRPLPATRYVKELRTDRRHMRSSEGGWLEPPPPWPVISPGESNLFDWLADDHDARSSDRPAWLTLEALCSRWG